MLRYALALGFVDHARTVGPRRQSLPMWSLPGSNVFCAYYGNGWKTSTRFLQEAICGGPSIHVWAVAWLKVTPIVIVLEELLAPWPFPQIVNVSWST
jgi:hypothetical protein